MACKSDDERQNWVQAIRLTVDLAHAVNRRESTNHKEPQAIHAANEMIENIESSELDRRERLTEVVNQKWEIKKELDGLRKILSANRSEIDDQKEEIEDQEKKIREELNTLNSEITVLDLFCRNSHRIQTEMIKCVSKSAGNAYAILSIQKKYASVQEEPYKSFYEECTTHFPDIEKKASFIENEISNASDTSIYDLYRFYHDYYVKFFLPKKDILEQLKSERFLLWKELVKFVTKKNKCVEHIEELNLIAQHIDGALTSKADLDFVDSLPEDTPSFFLKEWKKVSELLQKLLSLRNEQATIQEELDSLLQNRELLKDWSLEMKSSSTPVP
jgi:hypothetical protein